MTKLLESIEGAVDALGGTIDYEHDYVWGQGVLNSRRIWWNNSGHLVPLLDAVNCASPKGQVACGRYIF